jgi:flagellin
MSLGVLNNVNATYAENNLNKTSNSLSKVLNQLSSGSKINSGSDDAAGLSLVNGLQANQQALSQSTTNASEGVGLLQVADGALSQVTSLLNRAVTLATEVSNGTLTSSQQSAANTEYKSILNEVSNIGSTTTYNQKSVFGSTTNIYTGDSTTTGASVDSLKISSLSSSNLGDTNGSVSYKASATAESTTYNFGSGASSGTNVTKVGGTAYTTAGNMTVKVDYTDSTNTQRSFTASLTGASDTESLSQLATDITKGGSAAGVSATIDSKGELVLSAGTSGATGISIDSTTALTANSQTASGSAATSTYDIGSTTTGATAVTSVGGTAVASNSATGTVTYTDSTGAAKSFTYNMSSSAHTANDLATDIQTAAQAAGLTGFTASVADSSTGVDGYLKLDAGSSGATNISLGTSVVIGGKDSATATNEVQDNPTVVKAGVATMSYTSSAGTDLSGTDLSSQDDAQKALTALNSAITNVSAQDGYIGAQINTLNSVSSVISTQQTNIQSAQNAVQATDYATASSDMSKYEILSQTGISALAQANSVQQEVTKLLQ